MLMYVVFWWKGLQPDNRHQPETNFKRKSTLNYDSTEQQIRPVASVAAVVKRCTDPIILEF